MIRNYTKSAFSKGQQNLKVALLGLAFGFMSVPAFTQIQSSNFTLSSFASGTNPNAVAIGDFDLDGLNDIAIANANSNNVVVFQNQTTITPLSLTSAATLTMATLPLDISAADINYDGKLDLVVANWNSTTVTESTVSVFLNESTGSGSFVFSAEHSFLLPNTPVKVNCADFDNDGRVDVAVTTWTTNSFSLFRNLSNGTDVSFDSRVDVATGFSDAYGLGIADLDLDGKQDIVISHSVGNNIALFRNSSTVGSFDFGSSAIASYTVSTNPRGMVLDDFNNDGFPDVAVTVLDLDQVKVFTNLSSGAGSFIFGDVTSYSTGDGPSWINSGDLDDDGLVEVVTSNNSGDNISIFKNTTSGGVISFGTPLNAASGNTSRGVEVDDLTGNGINDIAVAIYGDNSLRVFENSSPEVSRELAWYPLDGDGNDGSGNGNDGVVFEALSTVDKSGNTASAYNFDGIDDAISGDASFFPTGSHARTIMAWVRLDASSTTPNMAMVYGSPGHDGGAFGLGTNGDESTNFAWFWGHNGDITGGTALDLDTWYHLAVTYDGTTAVLYLNGEEDGSATLDLNTMSGTDFGIGGHALSGWYMPGSVDEVRVYNHALTAGAISTFYGTEAEPGLKAHYTFSGNALDDSGFGNDGDVNGATLTTDRFGNANSAYSFDGIDDYISIPSSDDFNNSSLTISAWVKSDFGGSSGFIFGKGNSTDQQYGLYEVGTGEYVIAGWQSNGADHLRYEGGTVDTEGWVHLVGVIEENSGAYLYQNGVLVGSDEAASGTWVSSGDGNVRIGGHFRSELSAFFKGAIDDIRIYDYALDASEISALSAEGSSFVTTWEVTAPDLTIDIPAKEGETYDFTIDWGDGTVDTNQTGDVSHTYASSGIKTISITGDFPAFHDYSKDKIRSVEQWGNIVWGQYGFSFSNVTNVLAINATDAPDLSQVTELFLAFNEVNFTGDNLKNWDVSNVETMSHMFRGATFNEDLSSWDVSNVRNMDNMFFYMGPSSMGDISNWDVSSCESMQGMFESSSFDQDLSGWDVSNMLYMTKMFFNASNFNQNLNAWDISSVQDMYQLFDGSGMDQSNYDNTLIGWADLDVLTETQIPTNVAFTAVGIPYCQSGAARSSLINDYGWSIGGDVLDCPGLALEYTFNGNALDESGNGNDGTVNGATLSVDRFGNADAAYVFDGSSNYISTTQAFTNNQPFSVSVWVYWDGNTGRHTAVSWFEGSLSSRMYLGVTETGNLAFGDSFETGTPLEAGKWVHLVGTYDGSQSRLYIDGIESDISISGLSYQFNTLTVGRQGTASSEYWDGKIDDIRVFDYAMDASTAIALYTEGAYADPRDILMDFYNSTNGDNWVDNSSWGTDAPLNDWYGVDTNEGVVTTLSLASNNLTGTLPASLGSLISLDYLLLFNNAITGTIPLSYGNLTNATYFNISLNQLTGTIPTELANLTNCNIFSLSRNQLTGYIPEGLASFTNTAGGGIYLYTNQLRGLPDLSGLPSGTTLSIYDNKIGFDDLTPNVALNISGSALYASPQTVGDPVELVPNEGEELTLSAIESASGTQYQWFYNDEIIEGANLIEHVFNFTASVEGEYYCVMTNDNVPDVEIRRATYSISDGVNAAPSTLSMEFYGLDNAAANNLPVASFSAEDVDPGENHVFKLVAGEGDTNNDLFVMDGVTLRVAGNIDASAVEYSIRVRVTDNGGASLEEIFLLEITPSHTCDGGVFSDASGTISDGSGVYSYNADFTCDWLIQYQDKSRVLLEFTEFDTEFNYDFLYIYDGENDQAPLLAVLSGSDIPAPLQSGSESVYIRFVSDEYITRGGWSLNYSEIGPVAYYEFNGNADDLSDNANHATFIGATLANDRFGASQSAYYFDGSSAYIQTPATLTDNAPFSLSAWVNWNGNNSNFTEILSWKSLGNTYLGTSPTTNEIRLGDAWTTGVALDAGRWVHIVATYDGSAAQLYLDGGLVSESTGGLSYTFGGDMFLGVQGTNGSEFFDGKIDDVLIYDFVLTEENVASLYEDGNTDLLAYLPFTSGVTDATENGFDAYEVGSGNGLTTDRFGFDGLGVGAYNFDYINASPLEMANTINYDFGSEITVTAWIKPNSFPAADVSIVKNVMNGQGFDLRLSTGDLDAGTASYTRRVFGDITGISYGDAGEVYLGNWAHVAFTYSSSGGVRIYINGEVLINYGFVEGTEGSAVPVSEGSILIGDGFDGIIDEVQIHSSALSDEEIREVYSEKLWPFEAQALRGPEDVGGDAVHDLWLEPVGERYVGALDLLAGTYHFRLTDFDEGLPESFMGDNELDGVADAGGTIFTLDQGLYAVGLWESSLAYYAEPITSVGIIGSALTGDNSGWDADIDLTDMGSGIYQIKNIKLYAGEWKLRVNDTWNYLDWGDSGDGYLEYFGLNFFVDEGTYTLTADVVNNTYELIETSWGNWDAVAELYFDGDLTDESGYGNDGTSASVNYGTDRYGNTESALDLATTELVNLGSSPELYLSNGFTMNMWLNPITNDNAGTIFHSVGSFHNHIYPTEFSWRYFQNAVEIGIEAIPIEAPTGQWTMVTWVYDGGEMRFYDDGNLVHTYPVYGDLDITGNSYQIGSNYDGYVDDFMWIDGVLSDEEIKGLYNDHLWLYYPLNASATDESGNGYSGVLTGAVGDFDRFGDADQALYFDGASDIDAPALPITPNELTVSGWFNASSSVTGSQQIIDLEGVAALALYDDTERYIQGILNLGGDYIVISAPVTSDEWHFAALTYDENYFRLYLDGELVYEVLNTNQILYAANQFEVRLGRYDYTEGNYYTGAADDMRIYDRALSAEEIYELYGAFGWLTQQTGILADYPFHGDADDVSGHLNDGLVLGAELAYDRFGDPGSSFSFNGVDAYIELPEVDYFGGSDQLSVSWWVNPANTAGISGVLNFGNMLAQVIDGVLYTNLYFGGSGDVVGSTSLNLDEWQHLTLTYDGVNTRLYKNGSEVGVTAQSGVVDNRGSGSPSTIGTINGSADFFDGDIDDIKVYNRPLSASEVDELYRTGGFPFGGVIVSSLSEDFESECLPASWTEYNEGLDLINCGTSVDSDTYISMNGYAVGSGESWLITPMIDFNASSIYHFSLEYSNRFSGPDVEVLYSIDYTGVPNPTGFTWINLPEIESAVNVKTEEGIIANTGDILLPSLDGVAAIAFRYRAEGAESGQSINFSFDDVNVFETIVNEVPSALTLSNTNVYEGQEEGTDVGTFITTDPDSDTFTYSLVSGTGTEDDDNGSFAISGDRLLTGTGASFSLSGQTAYNILVRTEDDAGGVLDQAFVINVIGTDPADEANVKSYVISGQVGATTIDTDNAEIYIALENGTNLTALTPTFNISSGASTAHQSGVATDYTNGEFYFDVTSTDASFVRTWKVNIRSPHDPWAVQEMNGLLESVNPAFVISNTSGTETAWSIVEDPDDTGNNLLSLSNLNDGSAGMYKTYDLGASAATVVFRTKIEGTPERLTDVDIHLNGLREQVVLIAPDTILFQRSGLKEVVSGLDFSMWNTFRITADASSGTEMIVELYVGEESTPVLASSSTEATTENNISFGDGSTTSTYGALIDYFIFDKAGAYSPANLAVPTGLTVDGFYHSPTDISLSATFINEGESAGTQIGVFTTTDADSDTFTYTLVDGALDNASFSISGNELFSAETFDFAVKSTYSILVETEDEQGQTFQKEFTIEVERVADPADPYAIEWIRKNASYIGTSQYLNGELVASVDHYTNYARYQGLIKLSDDGEVTWVSDSIKYINDPDYYFSHLRTDDSGNIYALGHLRGTLEINDTEITSNDGTNGDLIILKYSAAGEIVEHVIIGGDGVENQYGFVVLPSGNLLVSFYFDQFFSFQGKNFDNGISSRALLELDASLNATATSVVHPDNYGALVLTNEDRLFMTNHGRNAINEFSLTDYSVIATYQLPDAYECYDHTNQMVADANGDLIFTGIEYTSGSSTSVNNIFAGKFNTGTNTWDWNYIMGSTGGNDEPVRLDVDGDNNVYLAGHYRFSWSVGGVGLPSATLQDIFLAKVDESGSVLWVQTYGSDEDDYMQALAVDQADNEVFLTAAFNGAGATVLTETLNDPIGIWLKLSPLGGDGPMSVSSIDGFGTYTYNDDQGPGFFNDSFDSGITDKFTVEALIRHKGFDGPGDWYNQFVNTQFFTIYVDYDDNENINLQSVVRNLPGQSVSDDYFVGGYIDAEDFGANTWHHIALTYGDGAMTFFLDGNVFMSYVAKYDPIDGVEDFLHLLQEVTGDIDEVRIWDEKRTLDAIRANIQNEIAPTTTGLVGYWPMNTKADDGSGSYTPDATGNGQHLFLEANADILELNLEPTDILLSNNSVREGLDINTVVGTLSTTDGNATDSHTYSLVAGTGDVDNGRFNINGNELRTSEIFTYSGQTYQIRIQTEDSQGATYQEIFFIGVDQNLNNAPTITGATFDIDENPNNGDIISDAIEFEDLDGDGLTFTITAGNSSGAFAIGSSDGVLSVADATLFDYESISPKFYTIEITVSDGIESNSASFTINVNNVEEAAIFSNFDAPDSYDTGNGGFTVSADIADPDGLAGVEVFYKKASETDFNVKAMTDNTGGNYSTSFSGTDIGLISIEYYVETTDILSNKTQSTTKTTSVNRSSAVALDVDNLAGISSGTTVEAYSILAFPFSGATVNGVFTNLMPYDEEKWRLVSYSSSGYTDKRSGGLTAGTGYFFITSESADIDVSGRSVVLDDGVYKINLSPDVNGWSLIGNPFQGELDWSAVVQHNIDNAVISSGEVQTSLQGYNGQFRSQNSLSILEGAFVNSSGSITGFEIPATAVSEASGGRLARAANAPEEVYIDELDWSLDLFFETPSYKYSVGGIGINPDAADDHDYHDLAQLPRFSTYLDLTFDDGSTRSIKQSDEFKSWEFQINNSLPEKYIDMTWDIPVSSSKTIIFVDAASRQIYDLSEVRNIKLPNDASAKHQLYYGDKDEIFENMDLPFDALFNLYPNPVRDYLNLELYASDNKNVTIEFVSIDGKVAYTEVLDLQRGLTRKQINLVGKNVPEGVYLIKVNTEVLSKFIKQ